MTRGRKPFPDELDLWKRVARSVSPIERAATRVSIPESVPKPPVRKTPVELPVPQVGGGKKPLQNDFAPTLAESFAAQTVRMDSKVYRQLRRGKVKPDARIDLHGMTAHRAHSALIRFVMTQHAAGKRLLLVITGKGKQKDADGPIPVRLGVLRHQVPDWLRLPPLAGLVLQVTPAHKSHGGDGAYYVYLRKSR